MKTDRVTKSLLLIIAFLLVGNLLAMLGGLSTPAYAKPGGGNAQYKVVIESAGDIEARLNKEAKNGWRVKSSYFGGAVNVILER